MNTHLSEWALHLQIAAIGGGIVIGALVGMGCNWWSDQVLPWVAARRKARAFRMAMRFDPIVIRKLGGK